MKEYFLEQEEQETWYVDWNKNPSKYKAHATFFAFAVKLFSH